MSNAAYAPLPESSDHLFFQCHLARLVWGVLRDVFRVGECPRSLGEFSDSWLLGKGPLPDRLLIFFLAGFSWAIWTARNKMAIEQKFPKAPTDIIYCAVSLMQRWSILSKDGDRDQVNQALEAWSG